MTPNGVITMVITGPDFDSGEMTSTTILVPLGSQVDAVERLRKAGLDVAVEKGQVRIDEPLPGTPFFEYIGTLFDFYGDDQVRLSDLRQKADRIPRIVFYIPAVALLVLVVFSQQKRIRTTREAFS